jgi:hypothetical protein
MNERTGRIIAINSHDYFREGATFSGCLATLVGETGTTVLYTRSERLQNTLEMVYGTQRTVTVKYSSTKPDINPMQIDGADDSGDPEGPFTLEGV